MQGNVLVIGSYLVGLVMETDRLPLAGETVRGRRFRQTHGGKGANMAVQAARLGAHVEFVGVIGQDAAGDTFLADLEREGIRTAAVRRSTTAPTGAGFIVVDAAGRNQIVIDAGANAEFTVATDLGRLGPLLAGGGVALAQCEIPPAMALAGLAAARQCGWRTILNPAPAVDLRTHDLSSIDYLTPNETEARICLGLPPDHPMDEAALAMELLARGVGAVIFTRGAKGARLIAGDRQIEQPAPVVTICDTVGAGDSFNAALATALAEGRSETEALGFASTVASLSTTRHDTLPSYHTRAEVETWLAR